MPNGDEQKLGAPSLQWALLAVSGISVACAMFRAAWPDRFDEKTAMFLAVAAAVLVIPQITKFKGFGVEFEKDVRQLKEDVKNVGQVVGGLEKAVGPGSKSASSSTGPTTATAAGAGLDPEDPNKGQFGGSQQGNGRKLSATITPLAGPKSARCQVIIRVEATDPSRPLAGKVKLHLHPTFGKWTSYDVDVVGGLAEDKIVSYGAFTIGAEADGGATRLELDLVNVPGGTKRFYEL